MISEAALTGKPVYIAEIKAMKNDYRFQKFKKLFNNLNITKNLSDKLEIWNYERLDESKRIAKQIIKHIS